MFRFEHSLRSHYLQKHGKHLPKSAVKKPKCSICSRTLQNQKCYDEHMENHDNIKFRCSVDGCGWMFTEFNNLQVHLLCVHKMKVRCGKDEFKFMLSPTKETQRHSSNGWFPCPICGRRLNTNREYHIEITTT